MKLPTSWFANSAKELSRNPLGIIALFIVLVYGIAALFLGLSSEHLQPNERVPLVYFLVLFPLIVLIAFCWLVAKHHMKLYAPSDFQDEENFFRPQSPREQKEEIDKEVRSIEEEATAEDETPAVPNTGEVTTAAMDRGWFKKVGATRDAYILAENLAFREIESEFGVLVSRRVEIGGDHRIDGVAQRNGKVMLIEIKLTRKRRNFKSIVRSQLNKFLELGEYIKPRPSFLLVVVAESLHGVDADIGMDNARKMFEESNLAAEVRFYDFEELKAKYGLSEG